jgi:putative membrane protein
MPNSLLKLHGMDTRLAYKNGWLTDYQQVEIDRTLTRLCDAMGKCERIKNTIFPSTYSLYIHFCLYLFITLLPFGLIEYFGIFEVPLIIAIAAAFLLVEKMAIHLQDPFENKPTDTPTTAISQTIERDLKEMLDDSHQEVATDKKPVLTEEKVFYIL